MDEFHFTVATAGALRGLVLTDEIRLVKAALLYGDRVTLASFGAAAVAAASQVMQGTETDRRRHLLELTTPLMGPELRQYASILTQRKFRRHYRGYAELAQELDRHVAAVSSVIESIRSQAGIAELEAAQEAGLLEIDNLGLDPMALLQESLLVGSGSRQGEASATAIGAMVDRIAGAVRVGSNTYPLFDEAASSEVAEMIERGEVRVGLRRPAEAGLAGHFVGRLPAFPDATVAEIIDVRRGLSKSLDRLRSTMAGMSRTVGEPPWDPGFLDLAGSLWRSNVEPALRDLEENAHDLGAGSLARHAMTSRQPWSAAGAVLVIALTAAPTVPDLAAAAVSVGTSLAAVAAASAEAWRERSRLLQSRERNPFLFLFEGNERLRNSAGP